MECKLIVLSDFDEIVDFITTAEKSDSNVILKRPGDMSEYNGKSLLSVIVLMRRNVEVFYDANDEQMEKVAMKYRVTSRKTGWNGYVMKQQVGDALTTGEEKIDNQHAVLIRFFNYIADACDHGNVEQACRIFENLKAFIRFQCDAETNLQKKYEYPFIEAHKIQHELLQKELNRLETDLKKADADAADLADYMYTTFFPLFFEHIREADKAAADYIVACENTESPKKEQAGELVS